MDAFYEEDERIVGHAADAYHRIDIRQTSRHLVVKDGDRLIADTRRPLVLFESGFAPRWYVPREDIDESALTPAEGQTFCPYKGLASYYDIGDRKRAAWYYPQAWPEVGADLEPRLLRAGRGRRLPRRPEARSRAGTDRRPPRNRSWAGPGGDPEARRRSDARRRGRTGALKPAPEVHRTQMIEHQVTLGARAADQDVARRR